MNLKFTLLLFISLIFCKVHAQQKIFINEIMASNDTTIADATGDYSDWFELYNSGTTSFSLTGCYVSDALNKPELFRFSGDIQIPAKGYIIIWASNDTTRGATHVPFKLSASGASIFLYQPDGTTLLDSVSFGAQITDISYGRLTDGSSTFNFFNKPTPGASNNTSTGYKGVLNTLSFSAAAGYYLNPFDLTISSIDTGIQIIYTLDGSTPDKNNIDGTVYRYKNQYPEFPNEKSYPFLKDSFYSKIYTNPISIVSASGNPNHLSLKSSTYDDNPDYFPILPVTKGMMVRAIAVKDGYISSSVSTATYFVTIDGTNKHRLPVISLAISPKDLFNWNTGIYVAGTIFEQWRSANPQEPAYPGVTANYRRDSTERLSSIEMFNANALTEAFQYNNGLGIHGGASRAKPEKSFTVYFRSKYGNSDFNYQIFPDQSYKDYSRLELRNSGGDWGNTNIRDMCVQRAVRHLNFSTQDGMPSVIYINGEYWGMLNIREHYDWHYFNQHYGIDEDQLDYMEDNAVADEGDNIDYLNLRQYISSHNLSNPTIYDSVTKRIDIQNYIDYYVSEIYYANRDWRGHNIGYFRKRVAYTPDAPYGQDGRYRWVMMDLDKGFGFGKETDIEDSTLQFAAGTKAGGADANPPEWATVIFRKLTLNKNFKNQFITRYADLLNTSFLPAYPISVIKYYHDLVDSEMLGQIRRWRHPESLGDWNSLVNIMDSFATQRAPYARQNLRDYFSLGKERKITLNVSDTTEGYIHINTVDILPSFPGVPVTAYPWSGLYYAEVPVTLIAKPKPGYSFSHWTGDASGTNDSIVIKLNKAMHFKAIFEKVETPEFIDYWHFNNLPDDETFTVVNPDSTLTGGANITYVGSGAGYMDVTPDDGEGSDINAQYGEPSGKALRPRNPSSTRSLFIQASTQGYKNIIVSFASTRTSKGAEYQRILYTVDGSNWILKQDSIFVANPETEFALESFDFTNDEAANNNPDFAVQIQFFGSNASGSSGNNRFDNITVSGIKDNSILLATRSVSFHANLVQKDVALIWSVTNQVNTSQFEIQRSTDGVNFAKTGIVDAQQNIALKSDLNYNFIDKNAGTLPFNLVFYRLKITDKDGKFIYSKILPVTLFSTNTDLQIIPNPVQSSATIKFYSTSNQTALLIIKSVNGVSVKTEQLMLAEGNNVYTFYPSTIARGTYYLVLKTKKGTITKKFVKE